VYPELGSAFITPAEFVIRRREGLGPVANSIIKSSALIA